MYRFLIGRRTVLALAGTWLVSGLLLFVAGWLLGRQESAPAVDQARLTQLLDEASGARKVASRSDSTAAADSRRRPAPWAPLGASGSPRREEVSGSEASSSSDPRASASEPASGRPASGPATHGPVASGLAEVSSSAGARPLLPATAGAPLAVAMEGSQSPGDAVGAEIFSLQLGAFASEKNAQDQIREISGKGHEPYIVPVADGARTLFTVRIGHYDSREQALSAAESLRHTDGMAAVIRPLHSG